MMTGSESEPNADQPGAPVVFREFLYADMDRARSLFAQLAGGIPEQETATSTRSRAFNVGAKQLFGYGRDLNTQDYEQRSLLDALFPELERILENGWLTGISDILHDPSITDTASLTSLVQPGSIVRLTAKTQLFDAEHLARALGGTSVALDGIMFFSGDKIAEPGSKKHTGKRSRLERKPYISETRNLEDLVEDFGRHPRHDQVPDLHGSARRARRLGAQTADGRSWGKATVPTAPEPMPLRAGQYSVSRLGRGHPCGDSGAGRWPRSTVAEATASICPVIGPDAHQSARARLLVAVQRCYQPARRHGAQISMTASD